MPTLMSLTPTPQAAVALSLLSGDTVAFTHATHAEPDDHARFMRDVAAKCQTPLLDDSDGRDIYQVFRDEGRFFLGRHEPVCSRRLKLDRLMTSAKALAPCTVAFANTSATYRQAQRLSALFGLIPGVTVTFPLIEQRKSVEDCRKIVVEGWGMTLPAMTAWLGEAVCLPCIRGTLAYYGLLFERNPEHVIRLAELEREIEQPILEDGWMDDAMIPAIHALHQRNATEPLLWLPCACH